MQDNWPVNNQLGNTNAGSPGVESAAFLTHRRARVSTALGRSLIRHARTDAAGSPVVKYCSKAAIPVVGLRPKGIGNGFGDNSFAQLMADATKVICRLVADCREHRLEVDAITAWRLLSRWLLQLRSWATS